MISDSDYARITDLLRRDVVRTLGEVHAGYVLRRAPEVLEFGLAAADEKLVEDVQQEIHDTFVDTSWPECPRHGKHPLWYRDRAWYCDRLEAPIAALGQLAAMRRP
jgi:hypothetical protein